MARNRPFDEHGDRYEAWFERHRAAYESELQAIRDMLPSGRGLEVGVGSGRFAGPLGIGWGVEPSERMRCLARQRGVDAVEGIAERLPYPDQSFDVVLMVTTICFVDRDSPLGRDYEAHRADNVFYRDATFYSAGEVAEQLALAGFAQLGFRQTIFTPLQEVVSVQPSRPGSGVGSFVVVRGQRNPGEA